MEPRSSSSLPTLAPASCAATTCTDADMNKETKRWDISQENVRKNKLDYIQMKNRRPSTCSPTVSSAAACATPLRWSGWTNACIHASASRQCADLIWVYYYLESYRCHLFSGSHSPHHGRQHGDLHVIINFGDTCMHGACGNLQSGTAHWINLRVLPC
jgi:hypothetical protein